MNKSTIALMLFCVSALSGSSDSYYVIDGWQEDNSVIKLWYTVLGLLDEYDHGLNAGFEVTFNENGRHFTADQGANWWRYYFACNTIGSPKNNNVKRLPRYRRSIIRFNTACTMSPQRARYLLTKYMQLSPQLEARLAQLKASYFTGEIPVIGVYYQLPMMDVQPEWDAVALCERVKQEVQPYGNCKVILFTSLDTFATDFMSSYGPGCKRITYLNTDKIGTPAEHGEHELLTLLLLAQCDMVIAPGSYQSIGAKMLNPTMQLIELNTIPYALK